MLTVDQPLAMSGKMAANGIRTHAEPTSDTVTLRWFKHVSI